VTITVLYFAVFRERLGRDEETLALADGATVRDAIDALAAEHAAIAALRGKFRCAVNEEFADDDRVLADGDSLALIPPVAGGNGSTGQRVNGAVGPEAGCGRRETGDGK
jgi:molybdopterin synthase catalytic subunit